MLFAIILLISLVLILLVYLLQISAGAKAFLAVLALIFDVLAFSTRFYTYAFMPFLRMKKNTVVLNEVEPFIMAPTGNAIVIKQGDEIYASAFVKIPIYKSATEMSEEERIDFARMFSRIISLSRSPVRFTSQLYMINKDAYINAIMDKLSLSEEQYQSLGSPAAGGPVQKIDPERIRGEVTMWHNLFDNVSKVKSHVLTTFAMVTVQGDTDEEAINVALQQADELASGISAILGITTYVVEGRELLEYIEVDNMIPPETVGEQMKEKSIMEGM